MSTPRKGALIMASSSFLFASMAVLVRWMSTSFSPAQLLGVRYIVGMIGVGGLLVVWRRPPNIKRPWLWVLRGVLGGVSTYLYFLSIQHLEVGPAALFNNTGPCYAAVFAIFFLNERLEFHTIAGLLLATFGAGLTAWSTISPDHPLELGLGAWAGLASAVSSGGAITVIRALRKDTDASSVFLSFCIFGLLFVTPIAAFTWRPIDWSYLLPLIVMGLFSTFAQMLYTYGMAFVPTAQGSATNLLTPAITWALAAIALGEKVTFWGIVGATICVIGNGTLQTATP
jgi:drug/metabolite transporter (DMT)-like permease